MRELARQALEPVGPAPRLIRPEQQAVPLLPQVVADVGIANQRQAGGPARDQLGDVLGDQVLVGERHDRQVLAEHGGHLAAAIARRIDHVLALDRSFRGVDAPAAVGQLPQGSDASVPADAGAEIARALGERLRQLRGVDIAVLRVPQAGADSIELEERVA